MKHNLIIGLIMVLVASFMPVFAATNYTTVQSSTTSIDEWGTCKKIINNAGKNIFIPTKTAAEWQSFINSPPSGITFEPCCDSSVMTSCNAWGSCSTTCGTGTQTRSCTNQCGNTTVQ